MMSGHPLLAVVTAATRALATQEAASTMAGGNGGIYGNISGGDGSDGSDKSGGNKGSGYDGSKNRSGGSDGGTIGNISSGDVVLSGKGAQSIHGNNQSSQHQPKTADHCAMRRYLGQ
jgi:hypothetical protein